MVDLKCSFCDNRFKGTMSEFIRQGWNRIKMSKPKVADIIGCKLHTEEFKGATETLFNETIIDKKPFRKVSIIARFE